MEKNDIVKVSCAALGTQGEGIAKKDDMTPVSYTPLTLPTIEPV